MEGRAQLKKKFEAANIGYESYRALIDSTINKKDDGIDIDERDGLRLAPGSDSGRRSLNLCARRLHLCDAGLGSQMLHCSVMLRRRMNGAAIAGVIGWCSCP